MFHDHESRKPLLLLGRSMNNNRSNNRSNNETTTATGWFAFQDFLLLGLLPFKTMGPTLSCYLTTEEGKIDSYLFTRIFA